MGGQTRQPPLQRVKALVDAADPLVGATMKQAASWASLVHRQGALDVCVEELADELVARVEELVRGARFDDPALPEDRDEVCDPAGGAEVVADHQVAAAVLLVDLPDQLAEQRGPHRIEA